MSTDLADYRDHFPKELLDFQVNELRPEVLAIHATNQGVANNSPSRSTMYSSHKSQHPVIDGSEIPRVITGTEVEYSKYTTSDRVPFNARVVQIIDRYPPGMTSNSLKFNPEKIYIICNDSTGEYDVVSLSHHKSFHQYFGYKNKLSSQLDSITQNSRLAEDTVLGDTPANIGDFYTFTTNLNCMLVSSDIVAEDSVQICDDVLDKFKYRVYEQRSVSVGARKFPVPFIPTSDGSLKSFYDIGDEVPAQGVLMWLREYQAGLAPVTMSKNSIKKIDYIFDEAVFARQGTVGKVVDIRVIGNTETTAGLPPELGAQFIKYRDAYRRFCERLLDCERRIYAESRKKFGTDRPNFSGPLITLLTDARAYTDDNPRMNLQLLMNKRPLDEFMIEFVIEYELVPTIGGKVAGIGGDKSVISSIIPRHRMPVTEDGVSVDIIMGPDSTIARTNFSRPYVMEAGAASDKLMEHALRITGLEKNCSLEEVEYLDDAKFEKIWGLMMQVYEVTDPRVRSIMEDLPQNAKRLHLWECLNWEFILVRPTDTSVPWPHTARHLRDLLNIKRSRVRHQLIEDGVDEYTIEEFLVAPYPIILLDKTAENTLTVSIASHGTFGILVKHNQIDKYAKSWKDSPPRAMGESENRTYASHRKDPMMLAEMYDRSNNLAVQLEMSRQFINTERPGAIQTLIDRSVFDYGESQPHGIANNFMEARGIKMTYVPEDLNPEE